jgi:signal peptidase I
MLPTVWSGDVLLVERVNPNYIQVGDIAVVGREGGLCAHRVVGLPNGSTDQVWITQGDAISKPDRPVIESELLGRVTGVIRFGKHRRVPSGLNVMERLLAQVVRRSIFATRVLIYMTSKFRMRRGPVLP